MSVLRGIRSIIKGASGFAKQDSVRDFARENPLATFGLVAPTVGFLGSEVAAPIASGAYKGLLPIDDILQEREDERVAERLRADRNEALSIDLRRQRIEEMVERNMAVVMQRDPHLFNQVMAGRILPQGAVVLGGPRRQDLMEELAYAMGTSQSPEEFSSLFS